MTWFRTFLRPCANEERACVCVRAWVCACFVDTMPCPAHVITFPLHENHTVMSLELRTANCIHTGGNLRMPYRGCVMDDVAQSNSFLIASRVVQICVRPCIIMLRQDFCWIVAMINSSEPLPEFFPASWSKSRSWLSCPLGIAYTTITPSVMEDGDNYLTRWQRLL